MPNYTDNLRLEKPLQTENYNIDIFNANADKIDTAIQEVKGKVDGLELTAKRVSIADTANKFEATNVEDALLENKTSILNNTDLANQALNKANEAFQRGDEVKTQLVDKLISEGLDVSTNDTFEYLINSITLGKRWASGIANKSFSTGINEGYFNYTIQTNLSFVPSIIILHLSNFDIVNSSNSVYSENVYISNLNKFHIEYSAFSEPVNIVIDNISQKSFNVNVEIPVHTNGKISSWYAFE